MKSRMKRKRPAGPNCRRSSNYVTRQCASVLLLRVNYLAIAHAFNDPDNGAVNCFKASEKTNEQWSDDGLKFTPSGTCSRWPWPRKGSWNCRAS
jgi:hypothetical protein